MTGKALLQEVLRSLRLDPLRSTLAAVGIIVGVAGIIVLGAAADGADQLIERRIEALGPDTLVVRALTIENGRDRGAVAFLTDEDATALRDNVAEIAFVSREVSGRVPLVAGNASWTTQFRGVDAAYADVYDVTIAQGRFFDDGEVRAGARVVVLGATVATRLFGGRAAVGRTLRIGGVPARVVGVLRKRGVVGGIDRDDHVVVPISTARSRLPKGETADPHVVDQIDAKVLAGTDRKAIKQAALSVLLERRKLRGGAQDKFSLFDATEFVELMTATRKTSRWLLAATAAISLVVGGVGIMNIMLVSVAERTREIGLRRAIGARKRDILAQFLAEALVLCVAAAIPGLALGIAGSYFVAEASGWPLIIGFRSLALALAASVGVGVIFGYVPARRAAGLDPIDALGRS